jgi:hypothetical protein
LKTACSHGDVEAGKLAAHVLSKTSRDGQVQDVLLETCHDACLAAVSDSLSKRDSAVPFIAHMRSSFDALITVLQQCFSISTLIDRSVTPTCLLSNHFQSSYSLSIRQLYGGMLRNSVPYVPA